MIAAVLIPALEIAAVAFLWKMASWAFGDLLMEHVGVPFLDCPWRRRRALDGPERV